MIVDLLSDLHGHQPTLAGGDLLIVAGDLTASDTEGQIFNFFAWLHDQPYDKKIVIAGNHDNYLQKYSKDFMELHAQGSKLTNIVYLCDSGTEFQGFKIWGSPWSLWFYGINPACAAFTGNEHRLRESYALIPPETDILITHTPPKNILDGIPLDPYDNNCRSFRYVGSETLYDRLCEIRPRLHVFGHIHEQGGKKLVMKRPGYGVENNTTCVNASIMNEHYKPTNKLMRILL